MSFFAAKKRIMLPGTRSILLIGGTGVLGKEFLEKKPDDVFVISVSRGGERVRTGIYPLRYDVRKSQERLLRKVARIIPTIDVVITMAYDHAFSSVDRLDRDTFLREIELDTFLPIRMGVLCASMFWSECDPEINRERGRKVIHLSSRAAFGKSARPELASYSGAKAALNVMTEYLHEYLYTKHGVSAHVIAPGSLKNAETKRETVRMLWELERVFVDKFTMTKI